MGWRALGVCVKANCRAKPDLRGVPSALSLPSGTKGVLPPGWKAGKWHVVQAPPESSV